MSDEQTRRGATRSKGCPFRLEAERVGGASSAARLEHQEQADEGSVSPEGGCFEIGWLRLVL